MAKAEATVTAVDEPVVDEKIRISITIDPSLRRNIRIAAAHADREIGDWCVEVLKQAALRAIKG
jgi:uncharacterized protein (DUF1778 family)